MIKPKVAAINKIKEKEFITFARLIKEQFAYGGTKYENDEEKESIDILCDVFGIEAILTNIMKYILRFKNLQRERDLVKASTYCYLAWLKMNYHKNDEHDADIPKT